MASRRLGHACPGTEQASGPSSSASPPRGRLIGGVLFVTVGLVWWQLDAWRITHGVIRWLSEYSPSRFGHGAIWTLPLSALLVGHITLAGVTVTFFVAVVAPYLYLAGPLRSFMVFAVAHIGATVTAFVVIAASVLVVPGWSHRLWIQPDYGASAGLVGIAGAALRDPLLAAKIARGKGGRSVRHGGNDGVLPPRRRRRGGTGSRHRRRRAPPRLAHRRPARVVVPPSTGRRVPWDAVLAATFRRRDPRGAARGATAPRRACWVCWSP